MPRVPEAPSTARQGGDSHPQGVRWPSAGCLAASWGGNDTACASELFVVLPHPQPLSDPTTYPPRRGGIRSLLQTDDTSRVASLYDSGGIQTAALQKKSHLCPKTAAAHDKVGNGPLGVSARQEVCWPKIPKASPNGMVRCGFPLQGMPPHR